MEPGFQTELLTYDLDMHTGGRMWHRLAEPLVFVCPGDFWEGGPATIVVPAEFHTDYASVPLFMRWLFPADGRWAKAAVLHDYLYSKPANCPRHIADTLFFWAMLDLGTAEWKASCMYMAVRCFGWIGYHSNGTHKPP